MPTLAKKLEAQNADFDMQGRAVAPARRFFVLYGRLIGPLLAGYMLFDKAFAYLHLPGTPLFVGEMVLVIGALGTFLETRYARIPIRDEPILALLGAFVVWGLIRALPGIQIYGIDAIRDSALWYYCVCAFFICAAFAASPQLLERLIEQLTRLTPWLLGWLPFGLVLAPLSNRAPNVPFSSVSILWHKSGDAAVAALLVLACMWVLPDTRSARSRAAWSVVALVVIGLAATQNRGGFVGVVAGAIVGLTFLRNRLAIVARAVVIAAVGLGLAATLSVSVPIDGLQGRAFSAQQLVANVMSLGGVQERGNLGGTVEGRQELWSRILAKQIADDHLVEGSGFGPNLASAVGVYDDGQDTLRSPHNSHLDIMARMGLVGEALWIALWVGWYWRLVVGARRLWQRQLYLRRQVAVVCMVVSTAILVSTTFDPQLEGPQMAALLWTVFGVGVAATTSRAWFPGAGRMRSVPRRALPIESQGTT